MPEHSVFKTEGDRREQLRAKPQSDRAILGRQLVALDTPQGQKTKQQFGLPSWLGAARDAVRQRFVKIYFLNRGSTNDGRLIVREERTQHYLESLAGLFRAVTGGETQISGDYAIVMDPQVLDMIDVPKKWN